MSGESAKAWLAQHAPDLTVIEPEVSTATVAEAAAALGVEPGRIAKTLCLRVGDTVMLVLARGDARLDNARAKAELGGKPRMLDPDETLSLTGHAVGGVCPFGLAGPLPVLLDRSLEDYPTVFPAAGSRSSAVEITPARLAELADARWVSICKLPE